MKKIICALVFLALVGCSADAYVMVKGHYRSNGAYVQPYMRTSPDNTTWNNLNR